MFDIVSLSAVTVDFFIPISNDTLKKIKIKPGSDIQVDEEKILDVMNELGYVNTSIEPSSGGSVSNTTDILSRFNLKCGLIGVGGNDQYGRLFKEDCKKSKLKLLLPLLDKISTGYNICFYDENGRSTIIWFAGANSKICKEMISYKLIENTESIIIDGFNLGFGDNGPETVNYVANNAIKRNKPYVFTLASMEIIRKYKRYILELCNKSFLVAGNLEQAAILAGLQPEAGINSISYILSEFITNFFITLGKDGVFAKIGNREYSAKAIPTCIVDTTGAGDAALAGFLLSLRRKTSIEEALNIATHFAAIALENIGGRISYDYPMFEMIRNAP